MGRSSSTSSSTSSTDFYSSPTLTVLHQTSILPQSFSSLEARYNSSLSLNMADALKAEGNKAFTEKKFDEAMYVTRFSCLLYYLLTRYSEKFTQAIEIEPLNHVLYSNRSGAYASKKDFDQALQDANKTTEIKPNWAKGWSRKGSALHGTGDLGMFELSRYTPKVC